MKSIQVNIIQVNIIDVRIGLHDSSAAFSQQKRNKACGPDGIHNNMEEYVLAAIDYISACYCAMWLPSRSDNFLMTLSVLWLNVQLEGFQKSLLLKCSLNIILVN